MQKDLQNFHVCLQKIEQALHWGDSQFWSNNDFEKLSEKIVEKTHVRLSVSTLKRVWGKVKYESSPTLATLNALARFLEYENWRDFEYKNSSREITSPSPIARPPDAIAGSAISDKSVQPKRIRLLIFSMIVVIVGVAIVFLAGKEKDGPFSEVVFDSHRVSDDLPNSVVFEYDASALHPKEVIIQQSWDPAKQEKVPPLGKTHTSIYYHPGHFRAKLIVDGEIIKEHDVFIRTKGWKGIVNMRTTPVYLHKKEISLPTGLGITGATLREKIGSPVFNGTWVSFSNVRDFDGLTGEDFTVETRLRNTSTIEQSVCRRVKIVVLAKNSAIIIPLATKGCISSIDLLSGDGWLKGNQNDLSKFGCSFDDFVNVKFGVQNNRLKVFLNNVLVQSLDQHSFLGDIIGLRFEFEGAGEIQGVKISGKGEIVYEENFSGKSGSR
jgi:hypothetical protein